MADWYTYEWYYEGEPARFSAHLALDESAREKYPALLCVDCVSVRKGASALSGRELRHAATLEKRYLKEDMLLAGRVETPERMQLYFYARNLHVLGVAETDAQKEKLLQVRADVQEDPEWTVYRDFLCPDAAKYQTEQNRDRIAQFKRAGDNPDAARRVRLHMYFPAEPLLEMFAEQARLSGFALGEQEFHPEMELSHGIVVIRVSTLKKREIDALTSQAIYLAERYDGNLAYWDCPLIPKKNPLK